MTGSDADRLHERLDKIEEKVDEVRDWMHQQKGGQRAFYALMGLSAAFGGLIARAIDWLRT